jgi:hypothetical protein
VNLGAVIFFFDFVPFHMYVLVELV